MKVESAADTASIATANSSANWTVRRALSDRKERTRSVIRHWHCRRRWPKADLEGGRALRRRDLLRDSHAEGFFGAVKRLGAKYRTPIVLVLAYLVMRILLLFFATS